MRDRFPQTYVSVLLLSVTEWRTLTQAATSNAHMPRQQNAFTADHRVPTTRRNALSNLLFLAATAC